jgi:acyl carrier protein
VREDKVGSVRRVLSEIFGTSLDAIDPGRPLREIEALNYDSAAVLEVIVAVEEEFGVAIDVVEDDVRHDFQSIRRIADTVERKLADKLALEGQATP